MINMKATEIFKLISCFVCSPNNMEALKRAIYDVKVLKKSIREAAQNHGISYSTLRRRILSIATSNQGGQKLLTTVENEKLLQYIDFCMRRGCPRSPRDVKEAAFVILRLRIGENARMPRNKEAVHYEKCIGERQHPVEPLIILPIEEVQTYPDNPTNIGKSKLQER